MRTSPHRALALASAVLLVGGLAGLMGPRPAAAAAADWATFSAVTGVNRDYAFTMQQPATGFPLAEATSTSSTASVPSGATTFLPPQTPVAAKYTTSRGAPYVLLAPAKQGPGLPSVTTYTFARPTPSSGWTFVLGDVDADQVQIMATDADGREIDPADLGFQSVFNYCAPGVSPRPSCGPPNNNGLDLPSWDPSTGTLTGNVNAADTAGASAWFEPTVPLATLSFTYAQRSGSPVYQTWFSALTHDLTGTVTAPAGQEGGITLRLIDATGAVVGTAVTQDDGTYSFPGYATYDDYTVELVRPDGLTSNGPLRKRADLSDADAVVDFALRAVVPSAVSGTVVDQDGDTPLGGVTVTLTPTGGGDPITTETNSDGSFLFDQVPAGDYTWSVDPPDGYTVVVSPDPVTVPPNSEVPIPNQDFELRAAPTGTLSGAVTDTDGTPVGGVQVVITGPDGIERTVTTDPDDGSYRLDGLPVGAYTITIDVPTGYRAAGPVSRTPTVPGSGGSVANQDFTVELEPTGTLSGTVAVDDAPPGEPIQLELTGDGFDQVITADPDTGYYNFTELPPGDYTITAKTPSGTRPVDGATRTATIDADGTSVSDVDFAFVTIATPTPTPSPTPSESPSTTPSTSPSAGSPTPSGSVAPTVVAAPPSGGLPDTGGPALWWLVGGALALVLGLTLIAVRPRGRRG